MRSSDMATRPFPGRRGCHDACPGGAGNRLAGPVDSRRPQPEPVEAVAREGEQVGQFADGREADPADQLDRVASVERPQVELGGLGEAGEVVHAQHEVVPS